MPPIEVTLVMRSLRRCSMNGTALIIETTPNTFTSNWWRSSSNGRCPSVRDADYTDTWKLVGPTSFGASESRHIRNALVNLRVVPHHAAAVSVAIFVQTSSF
jgi:hypothetical protein